MPIEPFAMPKGQLIAIIGHFWTVGLKSVAWGLDGAVNDNTAKAATFAASGRGLRLGFFAPNKSLADATVTRPRWAHFFRFRPNPFSPVFAYSLRRFSPISVYLRRNPLILGIARNRLSRHKRRWRDGSNEAAH